MGLATKSHSCTVYTCTISPVLWMYTFLAFTSLFQPYFNCTGSVEYSSISNKDFTKDAEGADCQSGTSPKCDAVTQPTLFV